MAMATEDEYHFSDSADEAPKCSVRKSYASNLSDINETLHWKIIELEKRMKCLSDDRHSLFKSSMTDRSQIIQLGAELLVKESQLEQVHRIEDDSKRLREEINVLKERNSKTHEKEAENISLKTSLGEKDSSIRLLEMEIAKERKNKETETKILRERILEFEETNKELNQEVSNKMRLLAEWENKFELLKQENIRLTRMVRRSISYPASPELKECFSCKSRFNPENARENECRYHPLPQMSYNQWQRWPVADKIDGLRYYSYHYYACCNTLSKQRPPGCVSGRHHVDWNINLCAVFQENERFMENDDENPTIFN